MHFRLLTLYGFAVLLQAQPPQDPRELLAHVRDRLRQTVERLPRYMCTLTVDRTQYDPDRTRRSTNCDDAPQRKPLPSVSDRLRLDVAIAATNEIYSWVGEDRFGDHDLFDMVKQGSLSTGTFSSFLASIFGSDNANFSYNGDENVDGRLLSEFGFRIPLDRSTYVFGNRRTEAKIPYDGTFLVDPKTYDLVRLLIHAGPLPPDVGACEATTTLDYGRVRLNDADFLLPAQVQLNILNVDGVRTENRTVYSSCHEFVGKSTLSFDEPAAVQSGAAAEDLRTAAAMPEGLTVQMAFTQPIDAATAAAGDPVRARLTKALRDNASKALLVPEGAAITLRIMKMQHFYGPPTSLVMVVKPETIEANGMTRPLKAYLASSGLTRFMKDGKVTVRQELGSLDLLDDRGTGVFEFRSVDRNFVVRTGTESTWITLGQ